MSLGRNVVSMVGGGSVGGNVSMGGGRGSAGVNEGEM